MQQYLLSLYSVEGETPLSPEQMETVYAETDRVDTEMRSAGVWVFAGGLHPADRATVVSNADGTVTTTDGPFADTKEHVAGFWIIRCADLDEALGWAAKGSAACLGPVEVRPFDDLSQG
jgi:hypothetical protein